MSGPTLDGLGPDELLRLCESTAVNHMQAEAIGMGAVLPDALVSTMRMAAYAGARAMLDELITRNLVAWRP